MKGEGTMLKKVKTVSMLTMVAVMSLFFVRATQGQELKPKAKKADFRGYFMFGGSILDIKTLNSRLESKGYSKFSDNFISFGGGCSQRISNRVIIGGEIHILIGEENEAAIASGNYRTSLTAAYGFFNLGYLVHSKGSLNVYPLLGVGGGGMWLKIGPHVFDEILENPKRSTELTSAAFLLNLALGTEYQLKLWEDEKGEGGLVLGLRFGYTFAPFKGEWTMDGIDVSGGPKIGITGPYIRLLIGFGGRQKI